jgi:hypothetical protein
MPDWDKILAQVAIVTAAPIPFLVAVLIAAGLIWWLMNWRYSALIAHKDAEIKLLERQKSVGSQSNDALTSKLDDYSGDPESEALDKDAYNQIVAFCLDYLLPACEAQAGLHRAIIRHLSGNSQIAELAVAGSESDWNSKTKGFWTNYYGLSDGLESTGGPQIKFDGIIERIAELEREYYRNFFEHTMEIARAANVEPNSGDVAFSEWHRVKDYHQKLVTHYEPIKRDIRFGKLHRLKLSRWGQM